MDPLDGKANFATGNPYFSVSIGLARLGEVLVGIVHDPVTSELYHAVRSRGAFLDGAPIRVSCRSALAEAFVAVGFSADEDDTRRGIGV